MSREPSKAQLSKLAYEENVPAFLQRLKARMSGQAPDEDEPSVSYDDGEGQWEESGDGRPAIPRRPGIPERPKDGKWGSNQGGKEGEPGRGDDDGGDDDEGEEAPQIVVLKEGKHLTADDVENERRAAKGLPPLPKTRPAEAPADSSTPPTINKPRKEENSMNFSSSKKSSVSIGAPTKKRKIIGVDDDAPPGNEKASKPSKKQKKPQKGLLSFQDDDG